MKVSHSVLVALVALAALSAVTSAYEPIADNKVPTAKAAAKPDATPLNRKLLQRSAAASTNMPSADQPKPMWGGYLVTPPFWVAGMASARGAGDDTTRRFDRSTK